MAIKVPHLLASSAIPFVFPPVLIDREYFGDGAMQQVSLTAGSELFGGRGHWEGSARYFKQDGILLNARPWGPSAWTGTGAGTAAQPIQDTFGGRFNNFERRRIIRSAKAQVDGAMLTGQPRDGIDGELGAGAHAPRQGLQW